MSSDDTRLKVYLASKYTRRAELLAYAGQLEAMGFEVVSTWIDGHHEKPGRNVDNGHEYDAPPEEIQGWGTEDLLDVMAADVVIQFTIPNGQNVYDYTRGGNHVEFGIGLGKGAICVVVGQRENVFHYLKGVHHFDTWSEAKEGLTRLGKAAVL